VRCKIRYTWDAVNDLDSIFDYISEDNKNAAAKMLARIEKAILSLSGNPRIGTVVSADEFSLIEPGYRKIIVKPYIIFYRIGDKEIYISRILHNRQDWIHLLFKADFNV
jgi:toxin ParE1/3/4